MRIKLCGLIACAAMLAAGVVSCQQHDDIPQGVKYPILFGSTDTRAVADIGDLQKDGFKVYAFVKGNVGSTSFAKNVKYTPQEVWAFESPEYWIPNTDYYFKAFYPSVPSAGTLTVANTDENQDFSITGFDITQQEDIMVASATASVEAGASAPTNGSVVPLNFQHLLANVIVKVKSEISNVSVKGVSFSNIANKGNFDGES
ncbi:MAG: fimbrillin family protein, partial [Alistipes sp.]|nr:fimbrillin family protein [Alistipes sp.]